MKLSKTQIEKHKKAELILTKEVLSFDEKIFVIENWNESAENMNSYAGAFFTPIELARDFSLTIGDKTNVVDLCAGIGVLSFFAYHYNSCQVTCIELNPDYVRVGKKILPEATWINASITDESVFNLQKFDQAISNPPFGKIKSGKSKYEGSYKGSEFEFIAIDIASKISKCGSFILPQNSTHFNFSGNRYYEEVSPSQKLEKFTKETGLDMELSVSIDTSIYMDSWNSVKPICEVVEIDFCKKKKNIKQ